MNEQEAIEQLQNEYLATNGTETPARVRYHNEALDVAIAALKEVQEYHATGHTPNMVRELRRGYLDAHKKAVQYATKLDEYHDIGGFEVCKAAVEKQTEKPVRDQQKTKCIWAAGYCPVCGTGITSRWNYCQNCGQKVKWEPYHIEEEHNEQEQNK
nr:MAG TPA: PROTEIN/RNA Complex, archaeal, ribosomal, 50S, protein.0A [Caudoviricetes sp.]